MREVWNVRTVVGHPDKNDGTPEKHPRMGLQAVVYRAKPRAADGVPVWELVRELGPVYARRDDNLTEAIEDGKRSGLLRDRNARSGGIAIELSDLLTPQEESVWRLDGMGLRIIWTKATSGRTVDGKHRDKGGRFKVALARETITEVGLGCTRAPKKRAMLSTWLYERPVGCLTEKQLRELVQGLGIEAKEVVWMPRKPGREVEFGSSKAAARSATRGARK